MAKWKQRVVAAFIRIEGGHPIFLKDPQAAVSEAAAHGGEVLVWASSRHLPNLKVRCESAGVPLTLMEDGFLRSKGLGSRHVEPWSLVFDRSGIYYDASRTSDLERMLEQEHISQRQLDEARDLQAIVVREGLSKYNVGEKTELKNLPKGREIILVAGQVGDDASIRLGTVAVSSNLALLKTVRQENPDAFIVYKPHPDVELGRRWGKVPPHVALRFADIVASDLAPERAIELADRVCVMTSLLGLEALLRGKPVTCYGMPFYAGWGLTEDKMSSPRRTRKRTLHEVLAAAYLRYARYIDPRTLAPSDALATAKALTS